MSAEGSWADSSRSAGQGRGEEEELVLVVLVVRMGKEKRERAVVVFSDLENDIVDPYEEWLELMSNNKIDRPPRAAREASMFCSGRSQLL